MPHNGPLPTWPSGRLRWRQYCSKRLLAQTLFSSLLLAEQEQDITGNDGPCISKLTEQNVASNQVVFKVANSARKTHHHAMAMTELAVLSNLCCVPSNTQVTKPACSEDHNSGTPRNHVAARTGGADWHAQATSQREQQQQRHMCCDDPTRHFVRLLGIFRLGRQTCRSQQGADCLDATYSAPKRGSEQALGGLCLVMEKLAVSAQQLLAAWQAHQHHMQPAGSRLQQQARAPTIGKQHSAALKPCCLGTGLPLPLVKSLARQALHALDTMHRHGLVHRDIKPANIMLAHSPEVDRLLCQLGTEWCMPLDAPCASQYGSGSGHAGGTTRHDQANVGKGLRPLHQPPNPHADTLVQQQLGASLPGYMCSRCCWKLIDFGSACMVPAVEACSCGSKRSKRAATEEFCCSNASMSTARQLGHHCMTAARGTAMACMPPLLPSGDKLVGKGSDFLQPVFKCSQLPEELLLYDTPAYAPPEAVLGLPIGPAYDIWSLGCVIYEMATGSKLFAPQAGASYDDVEHHLWLMQHMLGRFPRHMRQQAQYYDNYFTPGGVLQMEELAPIKSRQCLQQLLCAATGGPASRENDDLEAAAPSEAASLSAFLQPMLQLDPLQRTPAAILLQHPWLIDEAWKW